MYNKLSVLGELLSVTNYCYFLKEYTWSEFEASIVIDLILKTRLQ